ncbi:MAG: carbohydrate binding domain-containing protein [Bacteroidales bacterium]|jgi:hypothetical protein
MKKNLIFLCFLIFAVQSQYAQQNLVPNGGFEAGTLSWQTSAAGSSQANYTITSDDPASGDSCLQVEIIQLGSNYWDVQAQNFDIGLEEGAGYRISLMAKAASSGTMMNYIIGKATADYDYYSENRNITLSEEWEEYDFSFVSPVTSDDDVVVTLHFVSVGTVWVDDVKVMESAVSEIQVNANGTTVDIEFADEMEDPANEPQITFFVEVNSEHTIPVTEVVQDGSDLKIFTLHLEETIYSGDEVLVSYIPGTVATRGGIEIDAFSLAATNSSTQVISALEYGSENRNLVLYPVPATDVLYLDSRGLPDSYTLQVIDLSGRVLITEMHSGNEIAEIHVKDLRAGMYILTIQPYNTRETMQFTFVRN